MWPDRYPAIVPDELEPGGLQGGLQGAVARLWTEIDGEAHPFLTWP
jgi:hypothetical protein